MKKNKRQKKIKPQTVEDAERLLEGASPKECKKLVAFIVKQKLKG